MTLILRCASLFALGTLSACGGDAPAVPYSKSTYAAPGYENGLPSWHMRGGHSAQLRQMRTAPIAPATAGLNFSASPHDKIPASSFVTARDICGPSQSVPLTDTTPCI